MINWLDPLYVGTGAERNMARTIRRIRSRRGLLDTYVLTLPTNPDNQLDILHANYLLQGWYLHNDYTIIGIAAGYREARKLAIQIVQDAIQELGEPDIRRYLAGLLEKGKKK